MAKKSSQNLMTIIYYIPELFNASNSTSLHLSFQNVGRVRQQLSRAHSMSACIPAYSVSVAVLLGVLIVDDVRRHPLHGTSPQSAAAARTRKSRVRGSQGK